MRRRKLWLQFPSQDEPLNLVSALFLLFLVSIMLPLLHCLRVSCPLCAHDTLHNFMASCLPTSHVGAHAMALERPKGHSVTAGMMQMMC